MAKFFVGQRVRLVNSLMAENLGAEGVITHIGVWRDGDMLPIGIIGSGPGHADVIVKWDYALIYGSVIIDHGPCNSERLEPILPEGAQPLGYSFEQMMSEFGVTEAVK